MQNERKRITDQTVRRAAASDVEAPAANESHATRICSTRSGVDVLVIPTDEEIVIAGATQALTNTGTIE